MKKLLFTLFIVISFSSFSQQNSGDYTFKISNVTTNSEAKYPIDLMRREMLLKPVFNDSSDTFTVPGTQYLTEQEISIKMAEYGYLISDFKRTIYKEEKK